MSFATRFRLSATAFLLALVTIATSSGQGRAEEIRLDEVKIPAVIPGLSRPVSVALEGMVLRPDDGLSHPPAVLNHGSSRDQSDRPTISPYRMWAQAVAFARQGWVAVAVMRRGYGRSVPEIACVGIQRLSV